MTLLPHHVQNIVLSPTAMPWSPSTALRSSVSISGYAQLADFISTDKELAVYRRFDKPAARCLLRLQSRIQHLHERLDAIDRAETSASDEKGQLAASTLVEERQLPHNAKDGEKETIYADLTTTIKTYYDLLAAQSTILTMESPANRVKGVLYSYLNRWRCLNGLGERAYREGDSDLVALRPAKGEDRLSQFLRDHCTSLFKVGCEETIIVDKADLSA